MRIPAAAPSGNLDQYSRRGVRGFAHAQPLRAGWSRSEAGAEWRYNGAPLPGVLARSLCRAGARVSDKTLVRVRAVSCCLGISSDMSGYTPEEKLRLQQLRELRRRWLKDQELSPREPVLPPQRVSPVERFWNKFLQDGALWKNVVSDRPSQPQPTLVPSQSTAWLLRQPVRYSRVAPGSSPRESQVQSRLRLVWDSVWSQESCTGSQEFGACMALGLSCPLALKCDKKEANLCLDHTGRTGLPFFWLRKPFLRRMAKDSLELKFNDFSIQGHLCDFWGWDYTDQHYTRLPESRIIL